MAERRMFAKTIIDSDAFLEMPVTAQLLYFHLAMRADDDGFINKPRSIMRMAGAKDDDMKILIARKFVLIFEDGIVVIKHWRIHNYIRKDTYSETKYKEDKELLEFDENNAYRIKSNIPEIPSASRGRAVDEPWTQDRKGKDKDRIGKDRYIGIDGLAPEVQEAFNSFIEMRKRIRKPMTDNAISRMITKLKKMSDEPGTQVRILQQSEDHCWSDIYPLKTEERKQANASMMTHGDQMSRDIAMLVEEAERR